MAEPRIYTVGGTVQTNEQGLYISRPADAELLNLCQQGEFAFVLTPRQMGKSSLMIRTAEQWIEAGGQAVIIDLALIGTQLTAEQWYRGLLTPIAEQLMLRVSLDNWWQAHSNLGLTQRLTLFFQQVVLAEVQEPVVIFVDEIDTTLSLDFTDDFFVAIRSLYVARSTQPELRRLSFVLIGVAMPGDLIRDPQRTPFNIGHRVDLTDFTLAEAMPLATGLGLTGAAPEQTLGWVLEWTGGHPYLTQRLCQEMAQVDGRVWTQSEVDRLVGRTFLGSQSEQDNNLQFVRNMLTQRATEPVAVLQTYRQIRRGKPAVVDEEQSLVKSHLKLSGVVKRAGKTLRVRNQIYREVFDQRWIKEHLPENLWQRLKPALPLITTLSVSLAAVSGLAVYAIGQRNTATSERNRAETALQEAKEKTQIAEEQRQKAENAVKDANLQRKNAVKEKKEADKQRNQAKLQADTARREKLRAEQQTEFAETRRRESEKQTQIALARQLAARSSLVKNEPAFLLSRNLLLAVESMRRLRALRVSSVEADQALRQGLSLLARPDFNISYDKKINNQKKSKNSVYSPDGRYEALFDGERNTAQIVDTSTNKITETLQLDKLEGILALSPQSKYIAISVSEELRSLQVLKIDDKQKIIEDFLFVSPDSSTFSSSGRYFASSSNFQTATQETPIDFFVKIWDTSSRQEASLINYSGFSIDKLIFSSDDKYLFAIDFAGRVRAWKIKSGSEVFKISSETGISNIAVSANGKYLAILTPDNRVQVWDIDNSQKIAQVSSALEIHNLTFNPSGRLIALGVKTSDKSLGDGKTKNDNPLQEYKSKSKSKEESKKPVIYVWEVGTKKIISKVQFDNSDSSHLDLNFSPDGKYFSINSEVRDSVSGRRVVSLPKDESYYSSSFSPNSRYWIATDGGISSSIWEILTGKRIIGIKDIPRPGSATELSAIGPDAAYAVTANSRSTTGVIWRTSTSREAARVKHDDVIRGVTFNRDGKNFATWSDDGTTRVWESATGKEVARIISRGTVVNVRFSIDGKYLATATSEGTAQVNLWKPEDMIAEACSRLHRNLAFREWQQFIGKEPYRKTCPNLPTVQRKTYALSSPPQQKSTRKGSLLVSMLNQLKLLWSSLTKG